MQRFQFDAQNSFLIFKVELLVLHEFCQSIVTSQRCCIPALTQSCEGAARHFVSVDFFNYWSGQRSSFSACNRNRGSKLGAGGGELVIKCDVLFATECNGLGEVRCSEGLDDLFAP